MGVYCEGWEGRDGDWVCMGMVMVGDGGCRNGDGDGEGMGWRAWREGGVEGGE